MDIVVVVTGTGEKRKSSVRRKPEKAFFCVLCSVSCVLCSVFCVLYSNMYSIHHVSYLHFEFYSIAAQIRPKLPVPRRIRPRAAASRQHVRVPRQVYSWQPSTLHRGINIALMTRCLHINNAKVDSFIKHGKPRYHMQLKSACTW